jgi:hypothetical protein
MHWIKLLFRPMTFDNLLTMHLYEPSIIVQSAFSSSGLNNLQERGEVNVTSESMSYPPLPHMIPISMWVEMPDFGPQVSTDFVGRGGGHAKI